jgi:hypothetical protein
MAECSATIQYIPGPQFACTLTAGHKGPHWDAEGPVSWTCSFAVIQPLKW